MLERCGICINKMGDAAFLPAPFKTRGFLFMTAKQMQQWCSSSHFSQFQSTTSREKEKAFQSQFKHLHGHYQQLILQRETATIMSQDEGNSSGEKLEKVQLPFKAEYCKTSRAKCKKCSEAMNADSLKLAIMTKSRWHDGYDASFYHVKCFFQIKRPTTVAEIAHFETLKFEDQKMLTEAVETNGLSVLGVNVKVEEKKGKASGKVNSKNGTESNKAKKRPQEEESQKNSGFSQEFLVNYDDFLAEYAKSSRAKCCKCEDKIEKGVVRLAKLDYDAETAYKAGPVPRWYHVDCFVANIQKLEFYGKISKVKGFDDLEKEDQKMLREKVKPPKPPTPDSKKMKTEENPQNALEEKLLKEQSDRFFAMREFAKSMKRKDIEMMLEHMEQKSHFKSPSTLIDAVTDVLLFGPLKRCPKCKERGGMVLKGSGYFCTSGSSMDEPCGFEIAEPQRDVPDIPEEVLDKYPYLRDEYEFLGGKRIFPKKFVEAVKQKVAEDNNLVQDNAPLEGLSIGVISWKGVEMDKTKVQKKITTLGGKLSTALDSGLFVILSSRDQLKKAEGPKMEVARALGVPFAKPDFLFNIKTKDDVVPELAKSLLDEWQGDLKIRLSSMKNKG